MKIFRRQLNLELWIQLNETPELSVFCKSSINCHQALVESSSVPKSTLRQSNTAQPGVASGEGGNYLVKGEEQALETGH